MVFAVEPCRTDELNGSDDDGEHSDDDHDDVLGSRSARCSKARTGLMK